MPSITYTEDESAREKGRQLAESGQTPEPPTRYRPQQQSPAPYQPGNGNRDQEFNSARRMISAAQIMALVSLIIGGVLLSTAAIVVSVMAYRKVTAAMGSAATVDAAWLALKRLGTVAIVMSVVALCLNAVTFALVYPAVMDMLQSSDYGSLWGGAQDSTSSGPSVWG